MGKAPLKIIGLGFIYMYFEAMAKRVEDVSELYSEDCEVVFVDLTRLNNLDHETYPVVKLHGRSDVREYFKSVSTQLSTIELKIKTYDSLRILNEGSSILLSLTGEVFWSGTKAYNFTQTFILIPREKDDNVFDIANSVFRITTDVANKGEKLRKFNNTPRTKPKVKHYSAMSNSSPFIPASNQYQNRYNWNGYTGAMAEGSMPFYPQNGAPDYNQGFSQYAPQSQYAYYNSHNSYMNGNAKGISSNGHTYSRYSDKKYSHNNGKNSSEPSSNETTRTNSKNSSSTPNTSNQSQVSYRKATYYPVHVNNTQNLPEDRIKESLEKEFGTIMKITNGENYLVVDFEKPVNQAACLNMGKLTIEGVGITFEKKHNQRKSRSNTGDSVAQ